MIGREIDEVRNEIVGLKVIDIEPKGRAIHLEDKEEVIVLILLVKEER